MRNESLRLDSIQKHVTTLDLKLKRFDRREYGVNGLLRLWLSWLLGQFILLGPYQIHASVTSPTLGAFHFHALWQGVTPGLTTLGAF